MAVEIELSDLIIRKSALEEYYPGGIEGFAETELPNYVEDAHLVRIGYKLGCEAEALAQHLSSMGLEWQESGPADVAVVSCASYSAWLEIENFGDKVGCWLRGTEPGELIRYAAGCTIGINRRVLEGMENIFADEGITWNCSSLGYADFSSDIRMMECFRGPASIKITIFESLPPDDSLGLQIARESLLGFMNLFKTYRKSRQTYLEEHRLLLDVQRLLVENGGTLS